ncbi:ABC transporter permease [Enterococcus sp.]|uniref:ABC transporter permease n=1 Tax=Enterococcus sp. TaxID=35783 RepID=UPI002910C9D8|nr:ABC transporter permease [Enterococcus sp.]MDU5333142.1 ABC transporter permease [Enterococcus sp.]
MLLKKELGLTLKSLTYWLAVLFIGVFLFTQLGSDFISLKKPEPGQSEYGITSTTNKKEIQQQTISTLLQQYNSRGYNTYPFGFLKVVKLSKSDTATIKEILKQATGKSIDEINKTQTEMALENPEMDQFTLAKNLPIAKGYSYAAFEKDMKKVADLIGNGSAFSKNFYLSQARRQMTYQEATENFQTILKKDRVSGAFARMACDYLGLILGLVPVFVAATVVLRDKRAQSQLVVNSKRISTFKLHGTRFLSTVLLILLPVMILSLLPAIQSVYVAQKYQDTGDLLLFYQYIIGWTLPTIVAVVGMSFLITTLFNGLVSVIFQLGFWLLSLLNNGQQIVGSVRLNLIPRFNDVGSREVFERIFSELVINRIFWLILGLICFLISCVVFDLKRKGRMRYGNSR